MSALSELKLIFIIYQLRKAHVEGLANNFNKDLPRFKFLERIGRNFEGK